MSRLHSQRNQEIHSATISWIAIAGLTYFLLSLAAWGGFCGLHADIMETMTWSELSTPVVYPVLECVGLTIAFAVAYILCRRKVPGRELVLTFCIALAFAAFLKDIHLSLAQIHVFVKMPSFWANDFYVTWWLYSAGPYLKPAIRYSISASFFAIAAGVIWRSWYLNGRCSRLA